MKPNPKSESPTGTVAGSPGEPSHAFWALQRNWAVSSARNFNSVLDTVFYDVTSLTEGERARLSKCLKPEGYILVVHPQQTGRGFQFRSPPRFVAEQLQHRADLIDTLTVAGVGSSAIGAAALARNVADYLGRPVAAVLSGYGMADAVSEALGGWFVFGARNAWRQSVAFLLDALDLKDHVRHDAYHQDLKAQLDLLGIETDRFVFGSPDSATVLYLLTKLGNQLRLLVGHSKGNYSIENALQGWLAATHKKATPELDHLRVVTLGAVIWFSSELSDLSNPRQFIGTADTFGQLNSRPFVDCSLVPGAWHSLNSQWRGHLSVSEALRRIGLSKSVTQP